MSEATVTHFALPFIRVILLFKRSYKPCHISGLDVDHSAYRSVDIRDEREKGQHERSGIRGLAEVRRLTTNRFRSGKDICITTTPPVTRNIGRFES
ncbi:hypothetical protein QCE73_34540 [Caballeronia sp. LZ029]|uniref:hypothetical protein n=1 Tax=Caballeronia sp. LZ029 TaxID=3038564 RepID=UPI00286199C9|nr:hypothetical protein [Caballeronia sp. LZ029]MDR5748311.1 hypothetical protein [Caballeronia sp. LZ029]